MGLLRRPPHRQRPARRPPRRGPDLQGHLPEVPRDARPLRPPEGGLGLPRPAGRIAGREGARLPPQGPDRGVRHRALQRPVPGVGPALRRRLGAPHGAHRVLDQHGRRLHDDEAGLRRERLVEPEDAVRSRPAVPGLQVGAVLPALRDRPVRPRTQLPRLLPHRHRPQHLRALPAGRLPYGDPGRPAGLDNDTLDASVQPGRRGQPRGDVRPCRLGPRAAGDPRGGTCGDRPGPRRQGHRDDACQPARGASWNRIARPGS